MHQKILCLKNKHVDMASYAPQCMISNREIHIIQNAHTLHGEEKDDELQKVGVAWQQFLYTLVPSLQFSMEQTSSMQQMSSYELRLAKPRSDRPTGKMGTLLEDLQHIWQTPIHF